MPQKCGLKHRLLGAIKGCGHLSGTAYLDPFSPYQRVGEWQEIAGCTRYKPPRKIDWTQEGQKAH